MSGKEDNENTSGDLFRATGKADWLQWRLKSCRKVEYAWVVGQGYVSGIQKSNFRLPTNKVWYLGF